MAIISNARRKEIIKHWKSYLFQCMAASIAIFVLLLIVSIHKKPIIIASIAASTFIIFTIPSNFTARPRNLIFGHITGMLCGLFIAEMIVPNFIYHIVLIDFWYALAVGMSIIIMVATDTEHPPAAGTALGVVTLGFSWKLVFTIVVSIIFLASVHKIFKKRLRDLSL